MKRQATLAVALLCLLAIGGCVGLALGEDLQMDGEPASVEDEALGATDFEFAEARTIHLNETIEVAGQERRINATNHATIYERPTELEAIEGETGGFVVLTTPDVSIAGRSFNPAARLSHRELVEEVQGDLAADVGELGELTRVDERTEPVLGTEATVSTFRTNTTVDGETVAVSVHVTTVKHEGDLVAAIGVHPEALQQQAPEIYALMRGVEHPTDQPTA